MGIALLVVLLTGMVGIALTMFLGALVGAVRNTARQPWGESAGADGSFVPLAGVCDPGLSDGGGASFDGGCTVCGDGGCGGDGGGC